VVDHFRAGFGCGALVAWRAAGERLEQAAVALAGFAQSSHVYQRRTAPNWPYNLYTMVHGRDSFDLGEVIDAMSKACGIADYRVLLTEKELKKDPPAYTDARRGK
jgi:hypothetical protein